MCNKEKYTHTHTYAYAQTHTHNLQYSWIHPLAKMYLKPQNQYSPNFLGQLSGTWPSCFYSYTVNKVSILECT